MKRKKIVTTENREIYEKFNLLNFSPEIVLKDTKLCQVERILRNINKDIKILDCEIVGNYIVIKKQKPINFNVYLR